MSEKRFFKYLCVYYLFYYALAQLLSLKPGIHSNELHAVAQAMLLPAYLVMSARLIIFKPDERFAFPEKSKRILRFLLHSSLYVGLVFIPVVMLLHSNSGAYGLVAITPVLLLLFVTGIFKKTGTRTALTPPENAAEGKSSRWYVYYGLYLAASFFLPIAIAFLVPAPYLGLAVVALLVCIMIMMVWGLYQLTVAKPAKRFASLSKNHRMKRFAMYTALYLGLTFFLPHMLTTLFGEGSPNMSWLLMLFLLSAAANGHDSTNPLYLFKPDKTMRPQETDDERLKRRMGEIRKKYQVESEMESPS